MIVGIPKSTLRATTLRHAEHREVGRHPVGRETPGGDEADQGASAVTPWRFNHPLAFGLMSSTAMTSLHGNGTVRGLHPRKTRREVEVATRGRSVAWGTTRTGRHTHYKEHCRGRMLGVNR